jgi:hypothetical protein
MYLPHICLYNRDLLNRALKALGKSLVIVTGFGYGVIKAMDVLTNEGEAPSPGSCPVSHETNEQAPPDPAIQRLDGMEERLIRMEKSIAALILAHETPGNQPSQPETRGSTEHFITRAELDRAMQRLSDDINAGIKSDIDRRFEVQNRSVQSLRSMIARTDELLEQVIENMESTQLTA